MILILTAITMMLLKDLIAHLKGEINDMDRTEITMAVITAEGL